MFFFFFNFLVADLPQQNPSPSPVTSTRGRAAVAVYGEGMGKMGKVSPQSSWSSVTGKNTHSLSCQQLQPPKDFPFWRIDSPFWIGFKDQPINPAPMKSTRAFFMSLEDDDAGCSPTGDTSQINLESSQNGLYGGGRKRMGLKASAPHLFAGTTFICRHWLR